MFMPKCPAVARREVDAGRVRQTRHRPGCGGSAPRGTRWRYRRKRVFMPATRLPSRPRILRIALIGALVLERVVDVQAGLLGMHVVGADATARTRGHRPRTRLRGAACHSIEVGTAESAARELSLRLPVTWRACPARTCTPSSWRENRSRPAAPHPCVRPAPV